MKSEGRCPVCATALQGEVVDCERCGTPHHAECFQYVGHCAIFGCHQEARTARVAEQGTEHLGLWLTIHRYQWYALTVTVSAAIIIYISIVVAALINAISASLLHAELLLPIIRVIRWIGAPFTVLMAVSGGVFGALYVLLFVPAYIARRRLQDAKAVLPVVTGDVRAVADRLDPTKKEQLIFRWLAIVRYITGLFVFLLPLRPLLSGHVVFKEMASYFCVALVMYVLAWGLQRAATQRWTLVESVQNRLVASAKGKEEAL